MAGVAVVLPVEQAGNPLLTQLGIDQSLTNLQTGDDFTDFVGSSSPAAVAGYPDLTVPAGYAHDVLPLGVSFFGGRFSEPTLIGLGYALEQATQARRAPTFLPTLGS